MTLVELAEVICRARAAKRDVVVLVIAKGPKWWQRGAHIRSNLGLGRVMGTRTRKDGKPGIDVIAEYPLIQLERFLDKWSREHPEAL